MENRRHKGVIEPGTCYGIIRSALLLHDAMVFGNGQKEEFTHPEYVATYLSSDKWEEKLPDFIRKDIAGMIASHSGQWNVGDDNFHLRKPETECQVFVHMIVHIVESDECTTILVETLAVILAETLE